MSLRSLLTLAAGVAAGYAAARTLLERPDAAERLPEPLRVRARAARGRLERARARVREAIAAAGETAAESERELLADFHRRAHREPAPAPGSARAAFARLGHSR